MSTPRPEILVVIITEPFLPAFAIISASFSWFLAFKTKWLIFSSFKLPRYSSLGFIFIASGAIGNAIDRIIYGKVVDFIDFHIEDLHWPAFNLADTIIFIGAFLFLYNQFFTVESTYYEK